MPTTETVGGVQLLRSGAWSDLRLPGQKLTDPPLLSQHVLRYIAEELKFPYTSPVQHAAIPQLLNGKDVVAEAATGSGKTLAYLVPCAELLLKADGYGGKQSGRRTERSSAAVGLDTTGGVRGLIVLPSRELAAQVFDIAKGLFSYISRAVDGGTTDKVALLNPKAGRSDQTKTLGRYNVACFVGGTSVDKDLNRYQAFGAPIMVGTPGRLYDLLVVQNSMGGEANVVIGTKGLELLVLDEADRLLELGFKAKLDEMLTKLPKQRRTGLFSATQTRELRDLIRVGMRNPIMVSVKLSATGPVVPPTATGPDSVQHDLPALLRNYYTVLRNSEKLDRLIGIVDTMGNNKRPGGRVAADERKILVYTLTCASCDWLSEALAHLLNSGSGDNAPVAVYALHGKMDTKKRKQVYAAVSDFVPGSAQTAPGDKKTKKRPRQHALQGNTDASSGGGGVNEGSTGAELLILVCTDVAARGLDIPDISTVIQYDPPTDPKMFVHRIGRTARFGTSGRSVVFLTHEEKDYIEFLAVKNVPMAELPRREWVSDGAGGGDNSGESSDDDDAPSGDSKSRKDKRFRTLKHALIESTRQKFFKKRSRKFRRMLEKDKGSQKNSVTGKRVLQSGLCPSESIHRLRCWAAEEERRRLTDPTAQYKLLTDKKKQRKAVQADAEARKVGEVATTALDDLPRILQLGILAFVSFIRAYREHECRYIFQLRSIDIVDLSHAFALFKVPSMGELRHMKRKVVITLPEELQLPTLRGINVNKKAERKKETPVEDGGENKTRHHKSLRNELLESVKKEQGQLTKNQLRKAFHQSEMDELLKEAYLLKKQRKGRKLTERQQEILTGGEEAYENAVAAKSTRDRKEARKATKKL